MEKLRIAFLAYNLGQGGAERQLFYIARALVEQGCHPDIFTFHQDGFWEGPLCNLGLRVVSINERRKTAKLRKFAKYVSLGNYHFVHSQQFCTNLYAVAASLICSINCIGSIRNDVISEVRDPDLGVLGWFSLILPAQMVANSRLGIENAKKYLRNPKSIHFLPNVVDTSVFFPCKSRNQSDPFKIITVGTVWKPKRIDRVIEIANILKHRAKRKIIFEVFGDGDQLDIMINLARSRELLDSVVFFRGRSGDIASNYRQADALLLTSDHEGTPNVVLEAMSSGLPVIASRVGEIPEIIADGENGFSVEREDMTKMADIIEALSGDRNLCLSIGTKARELMVASYSPARLAERLAEIYSSANHHHLSSSD
jgi:glycosyltransferase involved in cell wall biosynthesis